MPCYVTGSEKGDLELNVRESRELATKLTRLLCEALNLVGPDTIKNASVELRAWWTKHQEIDNQRKQRERQETIRERTRREALRKLTPEERKALNV